MSSCGSPASLDKAYQSLPVELALEILLHAAVIGLYSDRTWAVSLLRLSSDVYRQLKPLLHHTMVVTRANLPSVMSISDDPRSVPIFRTIRRLIITFKFDAAGHSTDEVWDAVVDSILPLFTSLVVVDGPFHIVATLLSLGEFRPARLAVRYTTFSTISNVKDLKSVTHLEGYLPIVFLDETPREWALTLLAAVPSLTHLAFHLILVQRNGQEWRTSTPHPTVDPAHLAEVLGAVLEHAQISTIALNVAGEHLQDYPGIERVVRSLGDSRVRVCKDERVARNSADMERLLEGWKKCLDYSGCSVTSPTQAAHLGIWTY